MEDDSGDVYEVDIILDEDLTYKGSDDTDTEPYEESAADPGMASTGEPPKDLPEDSPDDPGPTSPGIRSETLPAGLDAGEPTAHEAAAESAAPGEAPGTGTGDETVLDEIREIGRRIDQIEDHFEGKLKYDEHKNRIIDDLHSQLQDFREGIIKKHLVSIVSDLIKIIDDTRKFKAHYETGHRPEDTTERLLDFIGQISSDLEDLFTFQGIFPYNCPGNQYDAVRQRIIRKIPTDDPAKNRLVAESLRPGYEWEGKVIRPEMVAIYILNDQPNGEATDS